METYRVHKLRIRGNYKDLCAKLGQELYEDIAHIRRARGNLPDNLPTQTDVGQALLEKVKSVGTSEEVDQLLQEVEQQMTPAQKHLRCACEGMNFKGYTCRPSWAKGAHIFVTSAVADEVEDAFAEGELGKGDLIVSPELLAVVKEALEPGLGSRGMCAYIHEPSAVEQPLGVFSAIDSKIARESVDRLKLWLESYAEEYFMYSVDTASARSARLTHSTGSVPRATKELLQSWRHSNASVQRASQAGLTLGPTAYKSFSLTAMPGPPAQASTVVNGADEDMVEAHPAAVAWETLSEQTSFTFATSDFEHCAPARAEEVMERCLEIHSRPNLKTDHAFAQYACEHFSRFHPEIVHYCLKSLPLESKLASTFNSDDADKSEGLKYGYNMLKSMTFGLFNAECLAAFFKASSPPCDAPAALLRAFDESVEILATKVAEAILPELKQLLRSQRRDWKKRLGASPYDGGCHVAAEQMRESFLESSLELCSKVNIEGMARSAWSRQRELCRRSEKEEQKAAKGKVEDTMSHKNKPKFQNRQLAGDKKAGMQDEVYQMWDGDKAARGPRPDRPTTVLRG